MPENKADQLITLGENLILFHDEFSEGFAFVKGECVPLRSKQMKRYITKFYWETFQEVPSAGELNKAINILEATAVFDNPQIVLFNRVGKRANGDDSFYYDLGNGKAVRVTSNGWTVCDAPVLFRRYPHQKNQVTPVKGNPWKLFEVINVESEYQLLTLVYVIACFIPEISHPVFDSYGDQGAGKTTACMMIKELVDPSTLKAQSIPKDLKELIQVLNHHYFPVFDNVSVLPDWVSDVFCQACTGGGLSKRKLFTNDEDVVFQFRRCIVLDGINVVIHKPDLMDRSILFPLERIHKTKRKTDAKLWEEFQSLKPSILGGIFDVLSKAMGIYPGVQFSWSPRMADFGTWGFAIGEALGQGMGKRFLEDYRKIIDRQNEEVVATNALAQTVLKFMEGKDKWEGTIGEAWTELYKILAEPRRDPNFPRGERMLRKHLAGIKTNLAHYGILYKIFPRTKDGYPLVFTRDPAEFGSFGSSSSLHNDIIKLIGEPNSSKEGLSASPNLLESHRNEPNEGNEPKESITASDEESHFNLVEGTI